MRTTPALLALAATLAVSGCRTANVTSTPSSTSPTASTQAPASTAPIPAGTSTLPAGTALQVRLEDALSTDTSKVGDPIRATLTDAIRDTSGTTIVPAGTVVQGQVTGVAPSSRIGEPAAIKVNFDRLAIAGSERTITSEITETKPETGGMDYGRAGKGAAIGGAGGALLGAVLGRSVTGAVVGGLLGAGAGTAISLGTGDVQATLPAGTPMTLRLTSPTPIG